MRNSIFNSSILSLLACLFTVMIPMGESHAQAVDQPHYIVGGQVVADEARYPFMTSVSIDVNGIGIFDHICGGSLIADRWVLTAAHCLNNSFGNPVASNRVGVWLGDTDLARRDGVFIPATRIILHPDFDSSLLSNDIALIELSTPYPTTHAVLPATDSPVPVLAESGIALGWGALREGGRISTRLREVTLPVVSNVDCFLLYRDSFDSRDAFCAGGSAAGGQDACQGDSGGPLLVLRENTYVVAGVVSGGFGCGLSGIPGVYTRVEAFTDWITSFTTGTKEYIGTQNASDVDNIVIARIEINTQIAGDIAAGQIAYFDVTGAKQVNLTSKTGDADLYIIHGDDVLTISSESLQCASENPTIANPTSLDVCVLDQQAIGTFAMVKGITNATYTLSSQNIEGGPGTVQLFTIDGQPVSQSSGTNRTRAAAVGLYVMAGLLIVLIARLRRRILLATQMAEGAKLIYQRSKQRTQS